VVLINYLKEVGVTVFQPGIFSVDEAASIKRRVPIMNLRKAKGFTLIELVIVIVIVGILASVSVPIYRGYTRKAMASEAIALAASVASAEKVYFAEHNGYVNVASGSTGDANIPVSAVGNKYFNAYSVTNAGATSFVVTVNALTSGDASGITYTFTGNSGSGPTTAFSGL
jgi:prepilin-type N-terminal cleavage/methylation domain-containing protein